MALSIIAGYGDSDSEESIPEDFEEVKKISDTKIKDLVVVKRLKQTNKKGLIQISLPEVKNSESSDEEDEVTAKKTTPLVKSGTGLTSLLPQPKRFRGTKRNPSVVPPSLKKTKVNTSTDGGDSLDAGDDSNIKFFSNLEDSEPFLPPPQPTCTSSIHVLTSESGPISLTRTDVHVHPNVVQNEYVCTSQAQQYSYGASDSAQTVSFSGYPPRTEHYTQQYSDSQQIVDNSSHYTCQSTPSLANPSTAAPDESLSVDEAAFYRLAGGGSKRGKKKGVEAESLMNIKDISENEIKDAVAYQKYLTEEHSHTSGTVPEHLVYNSTQKRKHQITWLAAQAKEREQELKSFWSQAAATRRQTQMKYGF